MSYSLHETIRALQQGKMEIDEALKWADNFGVWDGYPIDGNALALTALATEVRALRNEVAEKERERFLAIWRWRGTGCGCYF
jgi:hypothetical protein